MLWSRWVTFADTDTRGQTDTDADMSEEVGQPVDWGAVEAAYRAGGQVLAIAEAHGISRQAIYRRAEAGGWQRDVAAAVRTVRTRKLLQLPREYAPPVVECAEQEQLDAAVEAAAVTQVAIVTAHQVAAAKLRRAIAQQIDDLAAAGNGLIGAEKLTLPVRASTARQLAASLASVVDVERRAHGITDDGGETDSYEARLRKLIEEGQA